MNDINPTLESILKDSEALSMEGFTLTLPNFNEKAATLLNSLVSFFKSFGENDDVEFTHFNLNSEFNAVKTANHMTIRRAKVMQPKGLKVTYLEYLRSLSEVQKVCDSLLDETLKPFEKFLGSLLTMPDQARSQIESSTLDSVKLHNIDGAKAELAKNFDKSQAEKRPYGSLVSRTTDWSTILKEFNELATRVDSIDRGAIIEYVQTIVTYSEKLMVNMKEDSDTYEVSGVTASTLAKFVHTIAQEVEFYSLQVFNLKVLEESIADALRVAKS